MPFSAPTRGPPPWNFSATSRHFMPASPDLQAAVAAVTNPDWRKAARRVAHALNTEQPLVSQVFHPPALQFNVYIHTLSTYLSIYILITIHYTRWVPGRRCSHTRRAGRARQRPLSSIGVIPGLLKRGVVDDGARHMGAPTTLTAITCHSQKIRNFVCSQSGWQK